MNSLRFLPASLLFITSGAAVSFASVAHAASCSTDTDCPKSYTCQTSTVAVPCPAIACAKDTNCPPIDCEPVTVSECVPSSCKADSDCAAGMVCHTETTPCVGTTEPACPPGEKCAEPGSAPACVPTTTSACVPQYTLPCTTDAACGAGFTCVQEEECWSSGFAADAGIAVPASSGSGSSGSSSGSAGSATPPSDPGAKAPGDASTPNTTGSGCAPTGAMRCELVKKTCTLNSDCQTGWVCEADPEGTAISNVSCGGAAVLPDGGTAIYNCPNEPAPPPAPRICVPPYYGIFGYGSAYDTSGAPEGTGTLGLGGSASTPPRTATGTGGATSTGSEHSASGTGGAANKSDGGCQMGAGKASRTGASLLGLLGLIGIARRKRSRAA
jgi:hypothetical protein